MRLDFKNINKIVLLGGGSLLLDLAIACKKNNLPVFIVTSPRHASELVDKDKSLGNILHENSLPFLITKNISSNETYNFLSDLSSAFCLSIGAAWIFKKDIIDSIFKGRLFNLHGTRLPQNRGGGGFSWQIMMGNRLGFCQLHLIDSGIDTGNIVKTKEFLYPPTCRIPKDYEQLYIKENLKFIFKFIKDITKKSFFIDTYKQTEYFSTYWPRLNTKKNAWIDWNEEVNSLERYICAFDDPYPGASTFINDKKVFVKDVMVDFSDPKFHIYQSGIVYRKGSSWLSVCSNGGTMIVKKIIGENGNDLFRKIKVGDRFFTPSSFLQSRNQRVVVTPTSNI